MKEHLLKVPLIILFLFSAYVFLDTEGFYSLIEVSSLWVRKWFGSYYLYLGLFCVLFVLGIAFSPIGKRKLGTTTDRPSYSFWEWIAMLYSTGMGAGILLRAVQEPVFMYQNPPLKADIPPQTQALEYTFYQWGFTAWAFYGLFALFVGYYFFEKKKSIRISSTLGDSLKKFEIQSFAASTVDIITILTTIFGLLGAVGLGTMQINGGLNHLYNYHFGFGTALLITLLICFLASLSVWRGIDKGIKIISKANIAVTMLLLLFVAIQSDLSEVFYSLGIAFGRYLIDFVPLSIAYGDYNPGKAFLTDWTYYYWAFWLAWSPFTGIFIARISRGRTVRQMLLGVLIVPSLGTFIWFAVFGQTAFVWVDALSDYNGELDNVFPSIFIFLSSYPFATFVNLVVLVLLVSFLVTSVDSAIFVLSMFTDGGKENPSQRHRLVWSVCMVVFAFALLLLGNFRADVNVLTALQKLLIITSLPFAILIPFLVAIYLKEILKSKRYHS